MNERLQEKINVQPPSINMYGKYHPVIFFKDKNQFFDIEERIYDAYCLARNKRDEDKPHNENVDPDEIDI
jgi:predicted alpha/beta superfamily hydrolase